MMPRLVPAADLEPPTHTCDVSSVTRSARNSPESQKACIYYSPVLRKTHQGSGERIGA